MTGALQSDVLVIGGGPSGLAAAIAARLKGLSVTVADAARPPIDKACGEGIMPAGVDALRRLGVSLDGTGDDTGFPFCGVRFIGGDVRVEARFRGACGIALRRTRLHDLLVHRAAELGVEFRWGTSIRNATSSGHWIVGADGQHSTVRREAGLDAARSLSTRFGFRRHYQLAPWTDMVEVYWGAQCQVYVTPVGADEIGVALLCRDKHLRLDTALGEFPALQRRLWTAHVTSTDRGAITTSRRLRRVYRGHTVLIGDASGSVDAITGDGLSLSFLQAFALADALTAGDLSSYQEAHRQLGRRAALMSSLLLRLDRSPWLRSLIFCGLELEPWIFTRLLAMGDRRPERVRAVAGATLH